LPADRSGVRQATRKPAGEPTGGVGRWRVPQNADTPVSARPISSFWIWLVPSYSVITRASRNSLPTGYSSM
jgi:hypothetical protein